MGSPQNYWSSIHVLIASVSDQLLISCLELGPLGLQCMAVALMGICYNVIIHHLKQKLEIRAIYFVSLFKKIDIICFHQTIFDSP